MVMPSGINLSGSSVLPAARGRGVYRALVAARWDEAVERHLPALTVQAGVMSAPILERLGFESVGTQLVLCDRFD
jgi:GNAT superfamily N-acetyltransferase